MQKFTFFLILIFLLAGVSFVYAEAGDPLRMDNKKSWYSPSTKSGDSLLKEREPDFRHRERGDSLRLNEPVKPFGEKDPYKRQKRGYW